LGLLIDFQNKTLDYSGERKRVHVWIGC